MTWPQSGNPPPAACHSGRTVVQRGCFCNSAAWRVRIGRTVKGLSVEHRPHHLRRGQKRAPDYLAPTPQGLGPALLPDDPTERNHVRAGAPICAADTHPPQSLKMLDQLRAAGWDEAAVHAWAADANAIGPTAAEALAAAAPGPFRFGGTPMRADICLVPMLGRARRFHRMLAAQPACLALSACTDAASARQADPE